MTKILAIIPARGGSKGIPNKNIRNFAGKPLVVYSIDVALKSRLINRTIVSTDSTKIAKIAQKFGAEVPFIRPQKFADDNSPDIFTFIHALKWLLKHEKYLPEIVVHLRPTFPIRDVNIVDKAIQTLIKSPKADSLRAIIPTRQNPFKMWEIAKNKYLRPLIKTKLKEAYNMPRQLLPATFWQTGYIDVIRVATILKNHSMTGKNILPFVMNASENSDIDTLADWHNAEKLVNST